MNIDSKIIAHMESLPYDFWDFKKENVRVCTHGFHQYPAIMVCPISRHIIQFMGKIRPIYALLDPFMGSGTVGVEGMLAGIPHVAGNDLNPMAIFMSQVKTTPLSCQNLSRIFMMVCSQYDDIIRRHSQSLQSVDEYVQQKLGLDIFGKNEWSQNAHEILLEYSRKKGIQTDIPSLRNMGYWFRPQVIYELAIMRDVILNIDDIHYRQFFLLVFSECVRLVSNRRNGEFKMFRMPVEKLRIFFPDVKKYFTDIAIRNIGKMDEFTHALSNKKTNINITYGDARHMDSLNDSFYDLIITSPPYGDSRTTVAYGEFSRLSCAWLNLMDEKEVLALDKNLMGGAPQKNDMSYDLPSKTLNNSLERINAVDPNRCTFVYTFYRELNESIAEISKKTKIGGYHFWVVGNRIVKNERLLTDKIICELANQHGLHHIITVGRVISNKVMPSQNSPTNKVGKKVETMANEHIVVLRKD